MTPSSCRRSRRGAAFRALAERHGAVEISEVRRQLVDWQRDATRELATERTAQALERYGRAGMVHAATTRDEAKAALVAGWTAARLADAARRESPPTRPGDAGLHAGRRAGPERAGPRAHACCWRPARCRPGGCDGARRSRLLPPATGSCSCATSAGWGLGLTEAAGQR